MVCEPSKRKMDLKTGFLLITLFAGCLAIPTPQDDEDLSVFFQHADPHSRIVGGTVAPEASAPWMVALSSGVLVRSFSCGGSLISTRTILTAAHCIVPHFVGGSLLTSYRATLGTHRWNLGGFSYAFARNVTHQHYLSSTIKNDIGILITAMDVALSHTINVVPLGFDYVGGGVEVRATGWGRIIAGGALAPELLELYFHTLSAEQCERDVAQASLDLNMNAPPIESHLELCTFHSAGHGMCNGDSGSALVRTDRGLQVGIVSWGFPCAIGAPDMFARVSGFQNWVSTHLV